MGARSLRAARASWTLSAPAATSAVAPSAAATASGSQRGWATAKVSDTARATSARISETVSDTARDHGSRRPRAVGYRGRG